MPSTLSVIIQADRNIQHCQLLYKLVEITSKSINDCTSLWKHLTSDKWFYEFMETSNIISDCTNLWKKTYNAISDCTNLWKKTSNTFSNCTSPWKEISNKQWSYNLWKHPTVTVIIWACGNIQHYHWLYKLIETSKIINDCSNLWKKTSNTISDCTSKWIKIS